MTISPQDIEQATKNLTDWKTGFNKALAAFITGRTGRVVAEVTSFEDNTYEAGYCETCSYTQYEVTIYYKDGAGRPTYYEYDGRFSELLNELVS